MTLAIPCKHCHQPIAKDPWGSGKYLDLTGPCVTGQEHEPKEFTDAEIEDNLRAVFGGNYESDS